MQVKVPFERVFEEKYVKKTAKRPLIRAENYIFATSYFFKTL